MINSITIQPAAGLSYAYDASLAFTEPKLVSVETLVYDLMPAVTNRGCHYDASGAKIDFQNPFDGVQRVFIIYKT